MNKSLEIKMFDKAVEIQKLWVFDINNVYYDENDEEIWLPTQEQLQGMICSRYADIVSLLNDFHRFVYNGIGFWHSFYDSHYPNPSMIQLWLAFVMKELYNKRWNGEDWEVIDEKM